MKKFIYLVFICVIFVCGFVSKLILMRVGTIHESELWTFAVDSSENIYLCYMERIDVYHDKELLRTINPPTNKSYVLSIDNDKLLIGRGVSKKVGIYDLYGNFLEDSELSYSAFKNNASKVKTIEQNGKSFTIHTFYGLKPFEVRCDGVVIYKMSTIDYIYNGLPSWLFFLFVFFSLFFTIPMIVFDKRIRNFFGY